MKVKVLCAFLLITSTNIFSAENLDKEQKGMLLNISDAYSQCAAYYHIAGLLLKNTNQSKDEEKAKQMESNAKLMAKKINQKLYSADITDELRNQKAAEQLAHDNFGAAITKINELASGDKDKFLALAKKYSSSCSFAINNPDAFARQVLMADNKTTEKKPDLTLGQKPLSLDSNKIIARLKSGEYKEGRAGDIFCPPENERVTVSLNEMLVENEKVCLEKSKDSCNAKNNWLTYESYIQNLYPDRDITKVSYGHTLSVVNGETFKSKEIIACTN